MAGLSLKFGAFHSTPQMNMFETFSNLQLVDAIFAW